MGGPTFSILTLSITRLEHGGGTDVATGASGAFNPMQFNNGFDIS